MSLDRTQLNSASNRRPHGPASPCRPSANAAPKQSALCPQHIEPQAWQNVATSPERRGYIANVYASLVAQALDASSFGGNGYKDLRSVGQVT